MIRQLHRWLSLAFTLAVVVNIAALVLQQQTVWVGLLALFPLVLLLATGVYMFVLPYMSKWKRSQRSAG